MSLMSFGLFSGIWLAWYISEEGEGVWVCGFVSLLAERYVLIPIMKLNIFVPQLRFLISCAIIKPHPDQLTGSLALSPQRAPSLIRDNVILYRPRSLRAQASITYEYLTPSIHNKAINH